VRPSASTSAPSKASNTMRPSRSRQPRDTERAGPARRSRSQSRAENARIGEDVVDRRDQRRAAAHDGTVRRNVILGRPRHKAQDATRTGTALSGQAASISLVVISARDV
jgi:hypothetical protein